MNILITGGAGFIGSNLAERLLKEGHKVFAVDNLITGSEDNIRDLETKYPDFKFFELDVISQEFSAEFQPEHIKLDQIFHLACPTGVLNCIALSEEMIDTCSFGSKRALELAREHSCPIVVSSTAEVYGDPEVFPQVESYNGNVPTTGERSAYEEGKRFLEAMVAMFVRKYDVDAKIARIFNSYGPRMNVSDMRVHAQFIGSALKNEPISVFGNGRQTRTFCYVTDTIDGLVKIMDKGAKGEIYNLGSDKQTTVNDLAKMVKKLTNSSSSIEHVPHKITDHKNRLPSVEKLKDLGWTRQVELETGILNMIDYVKNTH
jgi:nucleoside-diphosphate-sugar epimerase